jgi:hypothetical protein
MWSLRISSSSFIESPRSGRYWLQNRSTGISCVCVVGRVVGRGGEIGWQEEGGSRGEERALWRDFSTVAWRHRCCFTARQARDAGELGVSDETHLHALLMMVLSSSWSVPLALAVSIALTAISGKG